MRKDYLLECIYNSFQYVQLVLTVEAVAKSVQFVTMVTQLVVPLLGYVLVQLVGMVTAVNLVSWHNNEFKYWTEIRFLL